MSTGTEAGRTALVTGLSGQDGSLLAELLLEKGYRVIGLVRGSPTAQPGLSGHPRGSIEIVHGDLLEPATLVKAVTDTQPDELYHLAAPSFVPDSWKRPRQTVTAIAAATATLLEAVRDDSPGTRVFVASSSAMFGTPPETPQREQTECRPQNPYAIAKLAAHQLTGRLRTHDGLFACCGILYNHESERRPESFVTRKITRAAAAIKLGLAAELVLGDLDAVRDWSFAGDVMRGAWLMLQQDRPDDFILASGVPHTVAEFANIAFDRVGLRAQDHIRIDENLVRSPEPTPLVGDSTKARKRLGWGPTVTFEELVHRMVDADLQELSATRPSPDRG